MALLTRNEYGIVAVNNTVLEKLTVDNMLSLSSMLVPCSKKGRLLRQRFWNGLGDMLKSVNIQSKDHDVHVDVTFAVYAGIDPEDAAGRLFEMIEADFETLCLDKPKVLTAHVAGTIDKRKDPGEKGRSSGKGLITEGSRVITRTNEI